MNSKEFVQACEDGKTLVWGTQGTKIIAKKSKKFSYIDLESGVAFVFEKVDMSGDSNVMMYIGETPFGVIPTTEWNIFVKEVKE